MPLPYTSHSPNTNLRIHFWAIPKALNFIWNCVACSRKIGNAASRHFVRCTCALKSISNATVKLKNLWVHRMCEKFSCSASFIWEIVKVTSRKLWEHEVKKGKSTEEKFQFFRTDYNGLLNSPSRSSMANIMLNLLWMGQCWRDSNIWILNACIEHHIEATLLSHELVDL